MWSQNLTMQTEILDIADANRLAAQCAVRNLQIEILQLEAFLDKTAVSSPLRTGDFSRQLLPSQTDTPKGEETERG